MKLQSETQRKTGDWHKAACPRFSRFIVSHRFLALIFVFACVFAAYSSPARATDAPAYPFLDVTLPLDQRVADLVARLTLEEKAGLMNDESAGVPRLGIKPYHYWNEALHGVARSGKFTVFPMASGMAATWNPELVEMITTAISDEAWGAINRDTAKEGWPPFKFLNFWSPTINMARDPRWGRTPETYGEDPYLTSRLAVAFVRGLQGYDPKYVKAVATPKHFAANNEEHNRFRCNAKISEKTLYEYYFPAFRATVVEGGALSVMGAYNAVNGVPCNANKWLLTDVLRGEWGFEGFVVTDCGAMSLMTREHAYSKDGVEATAYAVNAGVNVECGGERVITHNLVEAVRRGLLSEDKVNEATAELIRIRMRTGMFDPPEMNPYTKISPDVIGSPAHRDLARRVSQESIVLLKNDNANGAPLLPLNADKIKTIAIIGPYGDALEYGEYSGTPANDPVMLLAGVRQKAAGKINIVYVPWVPMPQETDFASAQIPGGFKVEFFDNADLKGAPVVSRTDDILSLTKSETPGELPKGNWSARWTGTLTPENSGAHIFMAQASGRARLAIGGQTLIEFEDKIEKKKKAEVKPGQPLSVGAMQPQEKKSGHYGVLFLEKGMTYEVVYEYAAADAKPQARLAWIAPKGDAAAIRQQEIDAIKNSDVVIAAMGYAIDDERESMDRSGLDLAAGQTPYILAAAALNPNVVLVLTNGSPVGIAPIQERVPAIVEAWYPGEQGGAAIADVLFGDYNPAGRTPFTYHKDLDDLPPFDDYEISKGRTYMYYKGEPLYPFGYGLSYTSFEYKDMNLKVTNSNSTVTVTFKLKNTGGRDGGEVAQVYARQIGAAPDRPMKKLIGFLRVNLKAGEEKEIQIDADIQSMARWDVESHQFIFEPGPYDIQLGASSADIRLKNEIDIK